MSFFTEDTLKFWRGLARNNNKEWFAAHRKDYEQHLKEPYERLAEALVGGVRSGEPEYEITPKQALYRINRDVRFSKDKTPYKTELGITIGRRVKHDPTWPAYTCRVGINGVWVAGGLYQPDPELRDHVRAYVGESRAELRKLMKRKAFKETFGELIGDAHKRAPAELKELAELEPMVLNKQWVFWAEASDPELLLMPDLDEFILGQWAAAKPINGFLKAACQSYIDTP